MLIIRLIIRHCSISSLGDTVLVILELVYSVVQGYARICAAYVQICNNLMELHFGYVTCSDTVFPTQHWTSSAVTCIREKIPYSFKSI